MSIPCPKCHKPLLIEDVVVRAYKPVTKLQTCGRLIVKKGGRVVATLIEAHQGIDNQGTIHGNAQSGGQVIFGAKSEWKGDLTAPTVAIKDGAKVLGGYFQIGQKPHEP